MAMIAHGGRFASLPIEDEREPESKRTNEKDVDKVKKKRKKKKPQGPDGDLQTMIFGGAKSKTVCNPSLTSPSSPPTKPFPNQNNLISHERDEQFESEMKEAMLESKTQFDFEQPKIDQKEVATINPATQSLQENDQNFPTKDEPLLPKKIPKSDQFSTHLLSDGLLDDFDYDDGEFKEIKRKPKKGKTPSQPQYQPIPHLPLVVDLPSLDSNRANFARNQELEKILASKSEEIQNLQGRVNKLNQDNLALVDLLSQGELKSKAELIREIEGINLDKVDMADELQRLSEALEQERTRSKTLRTELQRIQNKK